MLTMDMQNELKQWADQTADFYHRLAADLHYETAPVPSIYGQSDLTELTDCQLLVLGINPGAGSLYREQWREGRPTGDYLLHGNPELAEKKRKGESTFLQAFRTWSLYRRIRNILARGGVADVLDDTGRFAIENLVFFATKNVHEIPALIRPHWEACAAQTLRLADILKPRLILMLSADRALLPTALDWQPLVPQSMLHARWGDTPVLSIKHTAYPYGAAEMNLTGKVIGRLLSAPGCELSPAFVLENYPDEVDRFRQSLQARSESMQNRLRQRREVAMSVMNHLAARYPVCTHPDRPKDKAVKIGGGKLLLFTRDVKSNLIQIRHVSFERGKDYGHGLYLQEDALRHVLKRHGFQTKTPRLLGHYPHRPAPDVETAVADTLRLQDQLIPELEEICAE